ncbi:MAG: HSP20 family protein [Gammaproteobacteria bacterium]|jgi:HSP20 family protein
MNAVRYEPVNMIRQFHDEVNRLFQDDFRNARSVAGAVKRVHRAPRTWMPALDVNEVDESFVITVDVPGVDPKDIEITMEAGVLSIKGRRANASQHDGGGYIRMERAHGEFERRFSLPEGADADGIAATSNHGVLSVTIPKKPAPQSRRIEIL